MDTARIDAAPGVKNASRACAAVGCLLGTRASDEDPWTPHAQCVATGCISSDYVGLPPRPYAPKDRDRVPPAIEK